MTKDTPPPQLDAATEAALIIEEFFRNYDNDTASILLPTGNLAIEEQNRQCEIVWNRHMKKAKAAITRLLIRERLEAQTNAVAWTVGVVDDIHGLNGRIDTDGRLDRIFKGVKNTIRDRYKAEVGVDPAPSYPINARLQAQLEKEGV